MQVDGQTLTKSSKPVTMEVVIAYQRPHDFVSRGGVKLAAALERFGLDANDRVALDVGASTGGFTDCLLQHGALRVYAADVGHSQLDWKIRSDARVVVLEKLNCRYLTESEVPEPVDLLVADVSFISLTLILPAALARVKIGGMAVVLIKPQFELAREDVGRGGIVRDPALHKKAVDRIENWVALHPDLEWRSILESPIKGGDGNVEYLAWIGKR